MRNYLFCSAEILFKDRIIEPEGIQEVKNLIWMKIGLFLLVAVTTFSLYANEKESKIISFYIGAGSINKESNKNVIKIIQPSISLGVTTKVINNLQLGTYLSYAIMDHFIPLEKDSTGMFVLYDNSGVLRLKNNTGFYRTNASVLLYGIDCRFSFNEILGMQERNRLKLYALSKIGLASVFTSSFNGIDFKKVWLKPRIEYGVGIGVYNRFTNHFGVFLEYSFGQFHNNAKSNAHGGLVFNF